MAYTINRTDGTAIATVADGQIDTASTDITLIGKNFSGFGEYLNENLVKMLENFASDSQPIAPLTGQLWYDVTENRIKVYAGTEWKAVGTSALATQRPLDISSGDFWFNIVDRQLYFFDGSADYLIGPDYKVSQGQSGMVVESIEDSNGTLRTISTVYVGGDRAGFFSKQEFVPRITIPGFSEASVKVGFNPITQNFKFLGIATNSEALGGLPADIFAKKNQANVFSEILTVQTAEGIRFGDATNGQLGTEGLGDVYLLNSTSNRKVTIKGRRNGALVSFIEMSAESSGSDTVKIQPGNANGEASFGGNVTISGNLTVEGSTTTFESATLQVKDKNIELGVISSGSNDGLATGGGIILKGTTDHSILWDGSTGTWNSTENFNVPSGKGYKINGSNVLYDTGTGIELAASVTSAPGLTQFGNQVELNVDNITINDNLISNNGVTATYPNGDPANPTDLNIEPRGNLILIGTSNPKIKGLGTTNETNINQTVEGVDTLTSDELSEATSKKYVTNLVRTRSIPLTMDITGYYPNEESPMSANQISAELLRICPPAEYEIGTKIRISTVRYIVSNISSVQPSLTTTTLYDVSGSESPGGAQIITGVIREVDADQIGAQTPPRLYPIRGVTIYELNAQKTAWVVTTGGALVEDQTNPTLPGGLSNFIRP